MRYGGNTPCVEVRCDDGTLLIFDCGTGARKLGNALAGSTQLRVHVLLSHTHADHIQGLPFFLPAFDPESHLIVYGPAGIDRSLPQAVGGQMDYAYFPMPLDEVPARFDFVELGETEFAIDNVTVRTQFLNHTAPCLGYRVTVGGATFVYATDHEGHANPPWRPDRPAGSFDPAFLVHPGDASHASFLRGADVVLHDAQYSSADYPAKTGWGHSTVAYAVDIALAAEVRALVLFHHDPNRDDTAIDTLLAVATARAAASGQPLAVSAAAEGAEIVLEEREPSAVTASRPHTPRVPARARILVVDDDIAVVKMLESVLVSDGYVVESARDGEAALAKAAVATFDLVLLDIHLPRRDGIEVCRRLRGDERYRATPVIIVTEHTRHDDMVEAFAAGVSDYIRKPFAVAQVRARVRSWLTRSATVN